MLGWALTFLVVALIAAVLGFGGIAGLSIEIAKIIFFVAIVLFLISAVIGLGRGRSTTLPERLNGMKGCIRRGRPPHARRGLLRLGTRGGAPGRGPVLFL